ncbi:MAG TPA: hypothetical protein VGL93_03080 [Streptosporangiaceae bacterium]|jgi:alkylation response protein AidB-like acyl-CoA dehydrogenase
MGEFRSTMQRRLADAYASLRAAEAEGDHFMADTRVAEIEDLMRIAANNDLDLPECVA